ncbi:MAG: 2-hydroxyhexa-2,4-dienoate hydratase [Syntrophaceae bacterium PtaU1.Bin231]|nr:MAG: 2-hydroxyhexa-2,4-dienoate hydratase [Syntrophaceae bacterium PtaU1.Bin231]
MPGIEVRRKAEGQIALRERAGLVSPLSATHPDFGLSEAYDIAAEIVRIRRGRGERTVGRKIGFTNTAIWAEYGLDTPIWAHMYEDTVRFAAGDHAVLPLAGMAAPRIEPEIVLKLRSTPTGDGEDSLLAAIDWLAVGFEIVDCHYPALVIGTPAMVADPRNDAFLRSLKEFRIVLLCGGKEMARGQGAFVLGSPLLALRHLRDLLRSQNGEPLAPGEIVTTGTLTAALPVRPGETWSVSLDGIDLPAPSLTLA